MKTFVFDIDGTICRSVGGDYHNAQPIDYRIHQINNLYDLGNSILFYTARGMGTFRNDQMLAENKWRDLTISQLNNWGVKYHNLFFGKPSGDIYVDDKGCLDLDFFKN